MLSKHTLWHCTGVRKEGRKVGAMCAQHTFLGFMKSSVWYCWMLALHAAGQFVLFLQLFPIGGEERCEVGWPIRDIIPSQICHEPQTFPVPRKNKRALMPAWGLRMMTGEQRESVSLSIEILPGDYWSIDYAKWYSKTDRRWMLRKQNNLLSHWLNNQSATALVSQPAPLLSPVVWHCPWQVTEVRPATSLWEFRVRLSSFMAALTGVACLACADCQSTTRTNARSRAVTTVTLLSTILISVREWTDESAGKFISSSLEFRIIIPPVSLILYLSSSTIWRGSSDKF